MTGMTRDELLALPVVVGLQTAGRAWGLSRSRVYEAHAAGSLPFPVVEVSGRKKVTRAALLQSLDIVEAGPATGPAADTTHDPNGPGHASESHIRAVGLPPSIHRSESAACRTVASPRVPRW